MNIPLFISSRIAQNDLGNGFSKPVVRIAVISIALGLCVMLIAIAVVTGFQNEIRDKIIGFGGHIQITDFDNNFSLETNPISRKNDFSDYLMMNHHIESIHEFAIKAGIIKTEEEIHGVVFKGVGADYNWSFFQKYLIDGEVFQVSSDSANAGDKILISEEISKRLKLSTGDSLTAFFINRAGEKNPNVGNPQRAPRKYRISGIYNTGLTEFDEKYIIADIRQIQDLNNWFYDKVSGFEIGINDFSKLDEVTRDVDVAVGYQLKVRNIKELNPEIFNWLEYQNVNVLIIIVLMIIVGIMTMVSTLLIIILEKTDLIGILKALGMRNHLVRRVFLYQAAMILSRGLFWGNLVGLSLLIIQKKFEIIKLDRESYYLSFVPVNFEWTYIIGINIITLMICMIALILPSFLVTKISPVKAIRFD